MAVTRKLKSVSLPKKKEIPLEVVVPVEKKVSKSEPKTENSAPVKKKCAGCKTEPRYWDAMTLRRSLSDRGRIYPRTRTGCCAKHQRKLTREVKRARHLALLPFTVKV
ncbi:MAG: 30S ribosomal protein S18 [Candidatus Daviesbacteria bacterium]|nr:30S ribosomal protein S18 [Candidatus Daviesbacteria bacterium]